MTLTLPEVLMLFALRDDRGTVHSAAFLALDPALRGALLAELSLRGHFQIKRDGSVKKSDLPSPSHPLLREGLDLLSSSPPLSTVVQHLDRLANRMVDLRIRVATSLEQRGILVGTGDKEKAWMGDSHTEQRAQKELLAALALQEAIGPREGILTALTLACHLGEVVFGVQLSEAVRCSEIAAERSSIVRAVGVNIAEIEGAS